VCGAGIGRAVNAIEQGRRQLPGAADREFGPIVPARPGLAGGNNRGTAGRTYLELEQSQFKPDKF
jgi:hypothetical protein